MDRPLVRDVKDTLDSVQISNTKPLDTDKY